MDTTEKKVTIASRNAVMESMKRLRPNQLMMVNARLTSDPEKVQIEFAEIIKRSDRPIGLVGALNKTDSRFNSEVRPRRAWETYQIKEANKAFGVDFANLNYERAEGDMVERAWIGRTGLTFEGHPLHIQIIETTTATDWQAENLHKAAKSNGRGQYYLKDGMPIFSNTQVVAGKPNHNFVDHNEVSMGVPEYFEVVNDSPDTRDDYAYEEEVEGTPTMKEEEERVPSVNEPDDSVKPL
jgi:hypothetical protein